MIVFPLKWAPAFFIISGLFILFSEGDFKGLLVIAFGVVIGAAMHYFGFYKKEDTTVQKEEQQGK
jgi:uncharacterized membrane protein